MNFGMGLDSDRLASTFLGIFPSDIVQLHLGMIKIKCQSEKPRILRTCYAGSYRLLII